MIPHPLHAAVVHFPVVFALLLPVVAVVGLLAIRRGGAVFHWWGLAVAVMLALAVSSFAAVRTGEVEEDRVEAVVGEQPLHTHEEAAERFLVLTGALLALGAAGLLPRRLGAGFRTVATVATLGVLAAGWQVGHTGGQLVYVHGAAAAYVDTGVMQGADVPTQRLERAASAREDD